MTSIWSDPAPVAADVATAQAAVDDAERQLAAAQAALEQADRGQPADANSDAMIADLVRQARARTPRAYIGATVIVSTPLYVVPADQPLIAIRQIDKWGSDHALNKALASVPVPEDAMPSHNNDACVIVSQPETGVAVELWGYDPVARTCRWAGVATDASAGYWSAASYPGLSNNRWGISASGLTIAPGLLWAEELDAAVNADTPIPHALALYMPDVARGVARWPAQLTAKVDGTDTRPVALPYGTRLYLPTEFDVSTVAQPHARALAAAAQTWTVVVRERSHARVAFDLAHAMPGHKAWGDLLASGLTHFDDMVKAFPWEQMRVAPAETAPAAAIAA